MSIAIGDHLPEAIFRVLGSDGIDKLTTAEIFGGKKVVLFAVPGAFTPTCSARHLPGFVQHADAIKAKGVDTVACISVNDAFVMGAWGKDQGTEGKVTMLADGAAAFAKAVGLELDLNARGMGWRSQRYALVAENGKVTHLAVEQPGNFDVSKAESILGALPGDNTTDEPLPRALAGDNTTDDPRPIFTKRKT
jgi:peroxiredoxin (alkyl hydroperoxide reductase subunit C)